MRSIYICHCANEFKIVIAFTCIFLVLLGFKILKL